MDNDKMLGIGDFGIELAKGKNSEESAQDNAILRSGDVKSSKYKKRGNKDGNKQRLCLYCQKRVLEKSTDAPNPVETDKLKKEDFSSKENCNAHMERQTRHEEGVQECLDNLKKPAREDIPKECIHDSSVTTNFEEVNIRSYFKFLDFEEVDDEHGALVKIDSKNLQFEAKELERKQFDTQKYLENSKDVPGEHMHKVGINDTKLEPELAKQGTDDSKLEPKLAQVGTDDSKVEPKLAQVGTDDSQLKIDLMKVDIHSYFEFLYCEEEALVTNCSNNMKLEAKFEKSNMGAETKLSEGKYKPEGQQQAETHPRFVEKFQPQEMEEPAHFRKCKEHSKVIKVHSKDPQEKAEDHSKVKEIHFKGREEKSVDNKKYRVHLKWCRHNEERIAKVEAETAAINEKIKQLQAVVNGGQAVEPEKQMPKRVLEDPLVEAKRLREELVEYKKKKYQERKDCKRRLKEFRRQRLEANEELYRLRTGMLKMAEQINLDLASLRRKNYKSEG